MSEELRTGVGLVLSVSADRSILRIRTHSGPVALQLNASTKLLDGKRLPVGLDWLTVGRPVRVYFTIDNGARALEITEVPAALAPASDADPSQPTSAAEEAECAAAAELLAKTSTAAQLYHVGRSAVGVKRHAYAIAILRKAAERGAILAWKNLAYLYHADGQFDACAHAARAFLAGVPEHPERELVELTRMRCSKAQP